jgi:hypothetical protein
MERKASVTGQSLARAAAPSVGLVVIKICCAKSTLYTIRKLREKNHILLSPAFL